MALLAEHVPENGRIGAVLIAIEADLLARSGGNPFFLEELAALVRDDRRPAGETWPFRTELPSSLQALVSARLDGLPAAEREILEDAAVLGRRGLVSALRRMASELRGETSIADSLSALAEKDLLVVTRVDTGTWSQLPGLQERVETWPKPKLVVDHHLTQQDWATEKWVDTTAGACGEMVEELLEQWGVTLDHAMAQALFVAIVADTGWFMFSNTRPVTLRRAARLMEAGVDTDC